QRRTPKADWGGAGDRALQAFFGKGGNIPPHDRPRDVIMVGGIKTAVLVTMHAIKGTRPDWRDELPYPERTPAERGQGAMVVGECRGKNLYTTGSYCPLTWSPSPLTIVSSRMDYFAWHQGLVQLSETLVLEKFVALSPKAPCAPWIDGAV